MIVTSLGSGSCGNALLIRCGATAVLIDCGLSQRAVTRALAHAGLSPAELTAVLLTHEHGDHSHAAGPLARRYRLPVVASGPTLRALGATLDDVERVELAPGAELRIGAFCVRSFSVAHDAAAPVGYTVASDGWCVGLAIDLGSWDEQVAEALAPADLLIVEANHDQAQLRAAPYAWPIKQRIHSPLGHLDNYAAGELLARVAADGRRRTAWLAHLSAEANSPDRALRSVRSVLTLREVGCPTLAALPRRAPLTWESDRHGEQLDLFGGEP